MYIRSPVNTLEVSKAITKSFHACIFCSKTSFYFLLKWAKYIYKFIKHTYLSTLQFSAFYSYRFIRNQKYIPKFCTHFAVETITSPFFALAIRIIHRRCHKKWKIKLHITPWIYIKEWLLQPYFMWTNR